MGKQGIDAAAAARPTRAARRPYARAMGAERLRVAAIVLFAGGAILSGLGNESGRRWLTLLAFACFILGVMFVLRWRGTVRARVLDPEEKTSGPEERPPPDRRQ